MTQHDRLRAHPSARFSGDSHLFDLAALVQTLRSEAHPADHGHRQMTIFQRGDVTQVLFDFEAGGELPNHVAPGLVMIQCLEGKLTVLAEGIDYALTGSAGSLLVLGAGIYHDVRARVDSAMLLTVHLDQPASADRLVTLLNAVA